MSPQNVTGLDEHIENMESRNGTGNGTRIGNRSGTRLIKIDGDTDNNYML